MIKKVFLLATILAITIMATACSNGGGYIKTITVPHVLWGNSDSVRYVKTSSFGDPTISQFDEIKKMFGDEFSYAGVDDRGNIILIKRESK